MGESGRIDKELQEFGKREQAVSPKKVRDDMSGSHTQQG